ncbi:hypothetical protein [Rhizobium yanglingense]
MRVAQALEAGSVFVNDWAKVYDGTEEGGFKQSGSREAERSRRASRTSSNTNMSR